MKLFYRLLHELDTLQSWLFDGEPHIDGHTWQAKSVKKVGDRYYVIEECIECGKKNDKTWMDEMMYLRTKDQYPPLEVSPLQDKVK